MINGNYTIKEAREWLMKRGFERSHIWFKTMVHKKKIRTSKTRGRRLISPKEMKRILKNQPHLTVTVS